MQQVSEANAMKFSVQLERPESPRNDSHETFRVDNQIIVVPDNHIATACGFEKKEHSWFVMSQVPTDLSIQVQDITFYIHKYPLISRCGFFDRFEPGTVKSNSSSCDLSIDNFPGGPETFETILKFCYGLPITMNSSNVAAIRCASEFLEMTEALEDGNLISKAEAFFTFVVLSSWGNSITVLKSCETLSPMAENLQIVRRCCDSIAWKIYLETPTTGAVINEERWWFEDMSTLRIDHFVRIITALRAKAMETETIGTCIMQYADKWLPSMKLETGRMEIHNYGRNRSQWNIMSGRRQEGDIGPTKEQQIIVETLISILPPEKEAVSCKFLLKMLKMATLQSASAALISELEKKVGLSLERANVQDLLIPSYAVADKEKHLNSNEELTMYNTDVVQRILDYYLLFEQQQPPPQLGLRAVSKLLDSYLAEIARDPKLPVTKFQVLAQSMPENVRTCHDGIYRAIDTYLKTHPSLSEHERRKLCKVMDCGKLSVDACAHAAQNDRLPPRTMIQVLFAELVKLRALVQGASETETADHAEQERSRSTTNIEIQALKIELEKIKMQMVEIQRDYSDLQNEHAKQATKRRNSLGWTIGWKKIRMSSALFQRQKIEEEIDDRRRRRSSFSRRQSIS